MVSLWPWKGDDSSPASFERSLSALAAKISKTQAHLDALRQRGRRFQALWTLYTSFIYLLCSIIMFLVVGWRNWGPMEYSAVAASPLLIYLVRTAITSYYTFRIESITQRLEHQQAERAKTIDKLKAATRYNSTQELLEKYGGVAPSPPKPKKQTTPSKNPKATQKQGPRVSMGQPPATANIPRPNQIPSQPSTPHPSNQQLLNSRTPPQFFSPPLLQNPTEPGPPEFAPNAFSAPPQYAQTSEMNLGGHWYDRVLDLLLGEDETSPKNRMALICQNCRLVNGQAPPGAKTLADVGKWRCSACGAMNGEEDEGAKAVQEMKEMIEMKEQDSPGSGKHLEDSVIVDSADAEENGEGDTVDAEEEEEPVEETVEVKPKRGRPKGGKKKA